MKQKAVQKARLFEQLSSVWQGRLDSNQRMPGSKPGALPLGDAPVDSTECACDRASLKVMAGAAGFEPTHARIKTWCLTAWRRPCIVQPNARHSLPAVFARACGAASK